MPAILRYIVNMDDVAGKGEAELEERAWQTIRVERRQERLGMEWHVRIMRLRQHQANDRNHTSH